VNKGKKKGRGYRDGGAARQMMLGGEPGDH